MILSKIFPRIQGKHVRPLSTVKHSLSAESWEPLIKPTLNSISDTFSSALNGIKNENSNPIWQMTFDTIEKIGVSNKRHLFRPQLVVGGYIGGLNDVSKLEKPVEHLVTFSAAVELQHLFMLVHDDLVDEATFRRGEETLLLALPRNSGFTVDKKTTQFIATIVGDLLFVKSSRMLLSGSNGSVKAVDIILEGAQRAGTAQFEELIGWESGSKHFVEADEALLDRFLLDKLTYTGFVSPLLAGLTLSGTNLDPKIIDLSTEWARRAGAMFSGLQSISSLIQESSKTGKDQLEEIQLGRLSLPLLLLKQHFDEIETTRTFEEVLRKQNVDDRVILFKLIEEFDLVERCFNLVEKQGKKACSVVDQISSLPRADVLCWGLSAYNAGLELYRRELVEDFEKYKQREAERQKELSEFQH
eukprot:snap_masked-scaffold_4-processed-gene-18.37-mRNA-1 protein AED:1.00 eAED:1.00 QI:0/0/0/0/1/1/3/0/414